MFEKEIEVPKEVTVLGKTFASDEERRTYFRKELRKRLPELKKMEGFPIGEDDDIINLSDPPFYTACPNPWLNDFINEWENKKQDLQIQGLRSKNKKVEEPYAVDVSEGKNNPIYMVHTYHTKVPHPAIIRYLLHYTQPGDIVLDAFAGTGMTGVAGSLSNSPENELKDIRNLTKSKIGRRNVICSDLSPIASFIAYNYNRNIDINEYFNTLDDVVFNLEKKYSDFYKTNHNGDYGQINYIIWSDVFVCSTCSEEIIFFNSAVSDNRSKISKKFPCKNCDSVHQKSSLKRAQETKFSNGEVIKMAKTVPVLINYTFKGKRYEKNPDQEDLNLIYSIDKEYESTNFPEDILPDGYNTRQPKKSHSITKVNQFFSKRALVILNELNTKHTLFLLTASMWNASKLYRWRTSGKGGIMNGVLYVASLQQENNVIRTIKNKLRDLKKALVKDLSFNAVSTNSATELNLNSNSIDYIFTDPPFGANIMYSELSFLWESFLKVKTNNIKEAIENSVQRKSLFDYGKLMAESFNEFYRVLKPGKWMTVEFSNTSAAVWNSIQTALSNSGFIISNVSSLDKKQGSFKAVTTPTAVKQDLVISCYKPSSEFNLEFNKNSTNEISVWEFISEHLAHLPIHLTLGMSTTSIIERSPKVLYDRLIAFYVQRNLFVPIDAPKFQKALRERFIERDGMFFTNEQVQEYDLKKKEFPEVLQLSLLVSSEQDGVLWLKNLLQNKSLAYQDIQPLWMQALAGVRKGDSLPELAAILEENFLSDNTGKWYLPDPENEADLLKQRTKRLIKQFEIYKQVTSMPNGKIKECRVDALRAGFKQCYQDKDFKTIVLVGDRIPNNLLMEDEVLLQFYDIASSRV